MDELKIFYKILDEICREKNIEQKLLSYDWIRELKKEDRIHHIIRYQMDLNSANSYRIAKDKYATYSILTENNIPMIEHKMIFSPFTRSAYYDKNFMKPIEEMLEKNNQKIVIKANDSSQGKDVYYISNKKQANEIILKMFKEGKDSVSICPYVEIDYEYRVVILDGQALYVYKKRKPYVVGDGKSNIQKLIQNKYSDTVKITLNEGLDTNVIPKNGEEVIVSWKHNLSNGAEPIIVNEENDKNLGQIKEIAVRAGKAIGIRFATVDIALTSKKELTVVEINGSVCMNKFAEFIPNGYEIAKNIYIKAIEKMFEKCNETDQSFA